MTSASWRAWLLQHNSISRLKQARNADCIRYTYTMAMEQPAAGDFFLLPIVFARIFHHFQLIFPSQNTATHAPNNAPQHKNRAFLRFQAMRQNSPKMGIFKNRAFFQPDCQNKFVCYAKQGISCTRP